MLSPKYKELITNLINKTNERKVKWEPTSQIGRFELSLGNQLVSVYSSADEDSGFWMTPFGSPKAEFAIKDSKGREIDSLRTFQINDPLYKDLQPLYAVAKSSANNIDETIDSLLSSLNGL